MVGVLIESKIETTNRRAVKWRAQQELNLQPLVP